MTFLLFHHASSKLWTLVQDFQLWFMFKGSFDVFPAKAGIQWLSRTMDPRLREDDECGVFFNLTGFDVAY